LCNVPGHPTISGGDWGIRILSIKPETQTKFFLLAQVFFFYKKEKVLFEAK